ncbi:hypothetical protein evm_014862 [Chilo suppressalis]|nr:hypothetical protein evm_014862 [Chilo suppressalis]
MDEFDKVTTPVTTPTDFEEGIIFEYVPRRRKSKKGKTNRSNINKKYLNDTNKPDFNQSNEDSEAVFTNCVESETIQDEDVNYRSINSDINDNDNERISWDSQLSAPPETIEASESAVNLPKEKSKLIDENIPFQLPEENNVFNSRPLPKGSNTYEMENFQRNALFIFKQQTISGFKPNASIEKDELELKMTLSKFGFEPFVEDDLTKEELMNKLREYSDQDFTDYGCVVVAILTYGSKHGLIWAKDEIYSELELIQYFKVDKRPTLVTKPKIFIIQACVGEVEEIPYTFMSATARGDIRKDIDEVIEPYTLPAESDMLILHNSNPGKHPYGSGSYGSWFIQTLCYKINQLAGTDDFEAILREVKREVAHVDNNEIYSNINKDQLKMPVTTSTLIRKLYLRSFEEQPSVSMSKPHYDDGAIKPSPVVEDSVIDSVSFKTRVLCSCILDHFEYMKECLKFYLEDHPTDIIAQSFHEVAATLKEGPEFNYTKERMLHAISNYLSADRDDGYQLKYLRVYNKGLS